MQAGDPVEAGAIADVICGDLFLQAGDPVEAGAIADVICKERTRPLLVGSVKANMGHSEATAGNVSPLQTALV